MRTGKLDKVFHLVEDGDQGMEEPRIKKMNVGSDYTGICLTVFYC